MRGEHDVPAGIAGEHLGQHLLVAFIGDVADLHSEFRFELRNGLRRDVARPVVHVQAGTRFRRASGQTREAEKERASIHASRTLSEITISTLKKSVTRAEIALMTGLAPRRAIA